MSWTYPEKTMQNFPFLALAFNNEQPSHHLILPSTVYSQCTYFIAMLTRECDCNTETSSYNSAWQGFKPPTSG